jgi:hypothetical protein
MNNAAVTVEAEAVRAARAMGAALNGLGDALARMDLAGALAAEPLVTTALASMRLVESRLRATPDRGALVALRDELGAAREALARCARLGSSLDAYAQRPMGGTATYTAAGARGARPTSSAFFQRV